MSDEPRHIKPYHIVKRVAIDPEDIYSAIESMARWAMEVDDPYWRSDGKRILEWVADVRALQQKEYEYNGRR